MPVILGKQYMSYSSSLFSFLQPRATSFVFGPNILVNTNTGSPKAGSRPADKISGRLTLSSRMSWAGYEKFHLYSTDNVTRERQKLMQHNRALSPIPDRRVPAICNGCPPPSPLDGTHNRRLCGCLAFRTESKITYRFTIFFTDIRTAVVQGRKKNSPTGFEGE